MANLLNEYKNSCIKCGVTINLREEVNNMGLCDSCRCVK